VTATPSSEPGAEVPIKFALMLGKLSADDADGVLEEFTDQILEPHRLALSEALGLGTGAPWDAIRDRADQLRRAVDEAPTDRAALRDHIADVLAATDGWRWATEYDKAQSFSYQGYQTRADAVLAELPASADRAAAEHIYEYRIPCPGHRLGHSGDLIVQCLPDVDRWAVLNPNLWPGMQAWTGERYERIGDVSRHDAYRWTRKEALDLAPGLAEQETVRDRAWFDDKRTGRTPQ
jgi:hypothetical protein